MCWGSLIMPYVADWRVTLGGAPPGVIQSKSSQAPGHGSTVGSMQSRTTSDSRATPPKNLILCIGVPILYVVGAAPFRKECEVHAKPSGGCLRTARSTRCGHVFRVSAVQFVVGSCRQLMAHRLSGVFPAENLVRAASKYLSTLFPESPLLAARI
jgi:hypothetical protein